MDNGYITIWPRAKNHLNPGSAGSKVDTIQIHFYQYVIFKTTLISKYTSNSNPTFCCHSTTKNKNKFKKCDDIELNTECVALNSHQI